MLIVFKYLLITQILLNGKPHWKNITKILDVLVQSGDRVHKRDILDLFLRSADFLNIFQNYQRKRLHIKRYSKSNELERQKKKKPDKTNKDKSKVQKPRKLKYISL